MFHFEGVEQPAKSQHERDAGMDGAPSKAVEKRSMHLGAAPDLFHNNGARRLRVASNIPVIPLTGLGEETDRIIGLETGADDTSIASR